MPDAAAPNGWETRHAVGTSQAEVRENKRIHGYPIIFNTLSLDLGGFRERIAPSAVDRTLRDGIDVRAYFNHDTDKVLGRKSAGTLTLEKDRTGLAVEISPPATTLAKDLLISIRRGDISGMSFRFRVMPDGADWDFEEDMLVRTITDMLIGEVSIVSEPAYPATSVEARSRGDFAVAHEAYQAYLHGQKAGRGRDWFERRVRAAGIR